MNTLTTHIVNIANGFENSFNERVSHVEANENIISIRFMINANQSRYSFEMVRVFANVTYNVLNGNIKVVTENSVGSRKYNSYVKRECELLTNIFVNEAKKVMDVEIREENRNAYDHCHVSLLSLIDQTNPTHKNLCYSYINQILDMYQLGAAAHEMELKLIEVKREMLSDTRLFPKTETNKDYKSIWCKLENGSYVLIRTRPNECAERLALEWTEACSYGRQYVAFAEGFNPNYATQETQIAETIISSETNSLQLDLQYFASNQPRKLYESNYDAVKIITTSGEYTARIHPSEENNSQHKIFFSSDDYITVNDTDIISVTPIYTKTIITEHGFKKGIGRHLEFSYTIETTKADLNIDVINYSNLHEYKYSSLQKCIESFNSMQQMGWNNIRIITEVNHRNETIIEDCSECNIELDINTHHMDKIKKDNKQMKEELKQLLNELNDYKEFMKHYKAEKTFEQFKENRNNKNAS